MKVSNPGEPKPSVTPAGTSTHIRDHYQNVEGLAVRAKRAMNARLRLAPSAEVSNWVASKRPTLGGVESGVLDIIFSWTLGRGEKWKPIDAIALSQIINPVFALDGAAQTESQRIMVTRAVKGLIKKRLIRRIRGGQKGAHRSDFFYLSVVTNILDRPHQHHEHDIGREDADEVLDDLDQVEADGERIWAGHVTTQDSETRPHVTSSSYVSCNTAPLPVHVTTPNYSLSKGTLKRHSQRGVPLPSPPSTADPSRGNRQASESDDARLQRLDVIETAKAQLPWSHHAIAVRGQVA